MDPLRIRLLAQMYLFEQGWAKQDENQRQPVSVEVLPKLDEEVAELVEGFGGVMTRLTRHRQITSVLQSRAPSSWNLTNTKL